MISKLPGFIKNIVTKNQRLYYRRLKEIDTSEPVISLYSSNTLANLSQAQDLKTFINTVYANKDIHQRYLRLVPFFAEHLLGFQNKHFVVKMGLLPKAESLKLDILTNSGVITKFISLANLNPVTYDDFTSAMRRKMWEVPTFIDHEMVYFNLQAQEFYVFDTDATWDKDGLEHPALQLGTRYNEKQWYDRFRMPQVKKKAQDQLHIS